MVSPLAAVSGRLGPNLPERRLSRPGQKNRISRNVALGNKEHDCHDDSVGPGTAGTANLWRANRGQTENRPGLCRQQDDGDHGGAEDEDED